MDNATATHAETFRDALLALEQEGAGRIGDMTARFADDARISNSALRRRHSDVRGREGIENFWRQYLDLLGGARTTFSHLVTATHAAGLFWTTARPDDRGSYDGATLLEFDGDGRVHDMRGYYDPDAVKSDVAHAS